MNKSIYKLYVWLAIGVLLGFYELFINNISAIAVYALTIIGILISIFIIILSRIVQRKINSFGRNLFLMNMASYLILFIGVSYRAFVYEQKSLVVIQAVHEYKIANNEYPETLDELNIDTDISWITGYSAYDTNEEWFRITCDLNYWLFRTYFNHKNEWYLWDNFEFATISTFEWYFKTEK